MGGRQCGEVVYAVLDSLCHSIEGCMGGRQCGEVVLDSLCHSIEGCMGGTTVWGGSVRQPVSQHRGVYGGDDSVGR